MASSKGVAVLRKLRENRRPPFELRFFFLLLNQTVVFELRFVRRTDQFTQKREKENSLPFVLGC